MLPIPKTNADTIEPREGSSLYYSLLYCDAAKRSQFLNVLTLIDTLEKTLDGVREHHVAETKIHWWHEEIDRLFDSKARHPETKNCQHILNSQIVSKTALLDILSATASERLSDTKSEQDAHDRIASDFAARLSLLGIALGCNVNSHSQPLALGLGLHHRLNTLPNKLNQGLEVFSDELYKSYNTTPDALMNSGEADLMHAAIAQAKKELDAGLKRYAAQPKDANALPIVTMARLRQQQLSLWKIRLPNLVAESITLTPVRKLYIAWRTRKLYG